MNLANSRARQLSVANHHILVTDQLNALPSCKMIDGFFNQARLEVIKRTKIYSLYCSFKMIALIALSLWIRAYQIDIPYITPLAIGIVVNALMIFSHLRLICQANNLESTLFVASSLDHCRQQPISGNQIPETLQDRVSNVYDFHNIIDVPQEQLTKKLSELLEPVYSIVSRDITFVNCIAKVLSLVFIGMMIATLSKYPSSMPTKIISIVILILEIISRLDVIICLLIMTIIIPLVIILCCALCCCGRCCLGSLRNIFPSIVPEEPFNIQNHPQLQPIEFQATTLLETASDCNICLQGFQLGDKILILPCDNKHVFHQFCITTWFKVSTTCPLCRKSLAEMANGEPVVSP